MPLLARRPTLPALAASLLLFATLALLAPAPADAQYFGRNKVQYDDFEFKVFKTEHFEIYYYAEEEQKIQDVARMAERWYRRHSQTFLREFEDRKPLIFYANDADFHQTNAIGGQLGEGTGGVTESLKERVIMPLTGVYADTDHVLGHELVHSFQYDIGLNRTDSTRFALGALPLWLIEGTAEYLSVGREDAHTAMWLRDAALRDDIPTIDDLTTSGKYFPYRYGQGLMAYVGGKYGDAAVANIYKLGGRIGLDSSLVYTLGIEADSLSVEWAEQLKETYLPLAEGRTPADSAGRLVLSEERGGGEINIAPSLSPDGRYVAFISELDLFAINLFIADAETGEVIKRLKGTTSDSHFDAIRFINSSGSWSPDGRRFAFITFTEGDNEIAIVDVDDREIEQRFSVEGVGAITHPAWSPDGKTIAFSGIDGGISDLYLLDLETQAVRQLMADRYADLQPAWSPDGQSIAFVSDRGEGGTDFETLQYGKERLAVIDVASGEITEIIPFGSGARHHNPQFSPDGQSLYFISDQDGFKDVYRTELASDETFRVTHVQTGVSGISGLSPALSVAAQSGRVVFSVFENNAYRIFSLEQDEAQGTPVAGEASPTLAFGTPTAKLLPPVQSAGQGLVSAYLGDPLTGLPDPQSYDVSDYGARLRLDAIAPPSFGVSAGGPFGTRAAGGVALFFSDMLGNRNLTVVAQANGTLKDIGAQATYLNLKRRMNIGFQGGHTPILYGSAQGRLNADGTQTILQRRNRIYIDQLSAIASYPFTQTRRIEATGGFVRYGYGYEVEEITFGLGTGGVRQNIQAEKCSDLEPTDPNRNFCEPDADYFFQGSTALVGDFSFFGFTSPVRGGRYRFEVAPMVGSDTFVRLTADARRYLYAEPIGLPITFAGRILHRGNYGASLEDNRDGGLRFTQEYLGYANYTSFVRGYSFSSLENQECDSPDERTADNQCAVQARLLGTHVGLASLEARIPVFGTEKLGLFNFPYLPTELTFFSDAGLAWESGDNVGDLLKWDRTPGAERVPVFSSGVSVRTNLLGFLIFEVFYVQPWQRPEKGAHWGLQLVPGW